jgi:hypothetical protein
MKDLSDFHAQEIRRLIEQERWDEPLAPVKRSRLSPRQQTVFWGLRVYVLVMTVVVVWAFLHGAEG